MNEKLEIVDSVSVPASINEDRFGTNGNLAWLLDGASPASTARVALDSDSDATWLVNLWNDFLNAVDTRDPLQTIVKKGVELCQKRAKEEWISSPEVEPSSTLTLLRVNEFNTEYLVLGDSPAIFIYENREKVIHDKRPDDSNRHILDKVIRDSRNEMDFNQARAIHLDELARHRQQKMNQKNGYWVIARNLTDSSQAISGLLETPRQILLASDGFSRAVDTFSLAPTYRKLLETKPLSKIAELIRQEETSDPNCLQSPRWSTSDDCSAMLLEIND